MRRAARRVYPICGRHSGGPHSCDRKLEEEHVSIEIEPLMPGIPGASRSRPRAACQRPVPPPFVRPSLPQQARMVAFSALIALLGLGLLAGSGSALATLPSFHTPSLNIGCNAYNGYLRCDIGQKSWRGPSRPASCPLAYGDSFTMSGTGRPAWTCHGDTALRLGPVLPYGATWHSGPFTCTSRVNGLTCTNRRGHGFFLSRQSYRIF
jgi:hypothetical protein